jgi:hypothetical protein
MVIVHAITRRKFQVAAVHRNPTAITIFVIPSEVEESLTVICVASIQLTIRDGSRRGGGEEAPNSNIQAPENLQHPNPKTLAAAIWMLKFGASLDVGGWCLEFCFAHH